MALRDYLLEHWTPSQDDQRDLLVHYSEMMYSSTCPLPHYRWRTSGAYAPRFSRRMRECIAHLFPQWEPHRGDLPLAKCELVNYP